MKNIFSHRNLRECRSKLDLVETEIGDWQSKRNLPRHIAVPETQSHRGRSNLDRSFDRANYIPRVCRIDLERQERANVAVSILKYQLGDRTARQKHLENLRHNLEHRLQVAKSQGNSQLLNALQDEYEQLEISV